MSKIVATPSVVVAATEVSNPVMPKILPPVARQKGLATVTIKATQVARVGKPRLPIIMPRKAIATSTATIAPKVQVPEDTLTRKEWVIKPVIKLGVKVSLPEKMKLTDYKCRAECLNDIQSLYDLSDFGDTVTNLIIEKDALGFPDVDVSFTSPLAIDEILSLLATIEDAHVALESLDYAEKYTGERFRDEDVEEKKDPKKNPKKIPESCIREPGSVWPDHNYIDTWIGSIEHELKFQDKTVAAVCELYKECEKARKAESKEELDAEFTILRKKLDTYLDSLPNEEDDEK